MCNSGDCLLPNKYTTNKIHYRCKCVHMLVYLFVVTLVKKNRLITYGVFYVIIDGKLSLQMAHNVQEIVFFFLSFNTWNFLHAKFCENIRGTYLLLWMLMSLYEDGVQIWKERMKLMKRWNARKDGWSEVTDRVEERTSVYENRFI